MKSLNKLFIAKLKAALSKDKINPIPRSGPEGESVDCYSVYVTDNNGSYLADYVDGNTLHVNEWNEETQTHDKSVELNLGNLKNLNFEISHFHGLITHTYKTPVDFLLHELTGIYKVFSTYELAKYRIPKYIFSKRKLRRPDRIKTLESIIKMTEDNHNKSFRSSEVLSLLYGNQAILHPQYPTLNQAMSLILASLDESGELKRMNAYEFLINGKALTTLEHLREEKYREARAQGYASKMFWLTIVLALTASFQSNLLTTTYSFNLDVFFTKALSIGSGIIEYFK